MRILAAVLLLVLMQPVVSRADSFESHSVPLFVNGQRICYAVPMHDGAYTAAHCLASRHPTFDTVYVGGKRAPRWSMDISRDLAHMPVNALPQGLRHPNYGEAGTVRGRASVELKHLVTVQEAGQLYDFWCRTGGDFVLFGDSGSGVWAEDGALIGIVTAASVNVITRQPIVASRCGSAQGVVTTRVP